MKLKKKLEIIMNNKTNKMLTNRKHFIISNIINIKYNI